MGPSAYSALQQLEHAHIIIDVAPEEGQDQFAFGGPPDFAEPNGKSGKISWQTIMWWTFGVFILLGITYSVWYMTRGKSAKVKSRKTFLGMPVPCTGTGTTEPEESVCSVPWWGYTSIATAVGL